MGDRSIDKVIAKFWEHSDMTTAKSNKKETQGVRQSDI